MKTITMARDFAYVPRPQVTIQYLAGRTYQRVPEAAVRAIISAGAGKIARQPIERTSGRRRQAGEADA